MISSNLEIAPIKLSVKSLYKVFGPSPKAMLPHIEAGMSKENLLTQQQHVLGLNNINVDMIVQNISQDGINANITFTVPNNELGESKKIIEEKYGELNYSNLSTDSDIAKISVVGMGMMSQSGVAEKMFTTLAKNKINIQY